MKRRLLTGLMTVAMFASLLTGCSNNTGNINYSAAVGTENNGYNYELLSAKIDKKTAKELDKAYAEYIFNLMNSVAKQEEGNITISPDSVFFALGMTAAGANGETLDQMTSVLVPGTDNETALSFCADRMDSIATDEMLIANSIWASEGKCKEFYKDYSDYVIGKYHAGLDVFVTPADAVAKINEWTSQNTKNRINELVTADDIDDNTFMVLVNAICFDGKWKEEFDSEAIYEGDFTMTNGETSNVTFLTGKVDSYLSTEEATGFIKPYSDGKFAFMAILPNDGSEDINKFMTEMTAEDYWELWNSKRDTEVNITFPEFKNEFDIRLPGILSEMGMEDAFSVTKADFSNISPDCSDLYIADVIHKTYIDVNREGTEAAAATAVMVDYKGIDMTPSVYCDRPFAYAIVDLDTGLPVFLGTVHDM